MDRLRCNKRVIRSAAARLIASTTEVPQVEYSPPADLQVILDDLQDKGMTLADINKKIADLITNDTEQDDEFMASLGYHDKICNIMSRVLNLLNLASRPADSSAPVFATVTEPQKSPDRRWELLYRSYRYPFFLGNFASGRASRSISRSRSTTIMSFRT